MTCRGAEDPALSHRRNAVRGILRLPSLAVGLLMLAAEPAWAHLMPAQQGTLHILGNAVFAVFSLPLSALRGVDDNGDGHLSATELLAHEPVIRDEVSRRIRITDGTRAGQLEFLQVTAEPDERDSASTAGSSHFVVLMKSGFDAPPALVRMESDFWGAAASERELSIKATRGTEAEVAVLTPRRESHSFFQSRSQVAAGYVADQLFSRVDLWFVATAIVVFGAGWQIRRRDAARMSAMASPPQC